MAKREIFKKKTDEIGVVILDNNGNPEMEVVSSEDYFLFENIEDYKKYLVAKLNSKKDEELLSNGFQFDGHIFSLSEQAKLKWTNVPNFPDVAFPQAITTKDDNRYVLELSNKMNFYFAAFMAVKNKEDECGDKVEQVKLLSTLQECEDFEQNI